MTGKGYGLSDFGNVFHRTGRKEHCCEYCYGPIPKAEKHVQYKGMYDGDWQNWRMHNECFEAYDDSGQDCFCPGEADMPDRVRQLVEVVS
jgi:hypothetical protein